MLSTVLMAHPKRKRFVRKLQEQLPDAELVLDEKNDRWDTGRRALLAHVETGSDFALTVQDDAILCPDFLAGARLVAEAAGERPVGLYVGRPRPQGDVVLAAIKEARRRKAPWIEMEGPWWGVAIILPTADIEDLVAWGDANAKVANYDRRISRFYATRRKVGCYYTVPSLVDHRPVNENPSLISGRTGNRRAHWFIGERSPLEIDWTREPIQVGKTISFRHTRTKVVKQVAPNSPRFRRLSKSPLWEVE